MRGTGLLRAGAGVANDETPSEDGETPSVAAKWKHLFEKHKQKIIYGGGGAALVIAAGVVWSLARGQDATRSGSPGARIMGEVAPRRPEISRMCAGFPILESRRAS